MRLILSVFLIALLGALSLAQAPKSAGLTLQFASASEREIWFGSGPEAAPTGEPIVSSGEATPIELGTGTLMLVRDRTNGNLATRSVADVRAGKTSFASGDFSRVGLVRVRVEFGGQPVSAASVEFSDGGAKRTQVIGPSSAGEVTFRNVRPGKATVTVNYNSNGQAAPPITQTFDVPLSRPEPEPTLKVAVSETTDVVGAASAPIQSEGGKAEPPKTDDKSTPSNPIGQALVYLVFLGAVIGAGYYGLRYFQNNQDKLAPKLQQLGVQIPQPGDAPVTGADPVIPAPIAPAPVQKIVLDPSSAPDPTPYTPVAAPVATGQPRLVSEAGTTIPLAEGECVVGREVGLGISLEGESTVSRRHASVLVSGGVVTVRDHGSTNGSFVNGVKVSGDTVISPGDVLQFGAVRFRYEG